MYRVSATNYDRCRRLLAQYEIMGSKLHMRDIHSFMGWADKTTLRQQCNFAPLQGLLKKFEEELVKDQFIAQKPMLLSKTSAVFMILNYHSTKWMHHSSSLLLKWIENERRLNMDEVFSVYNMLVEMGWQEDKALQAIRLKVISLLGQFIERDSNEFAKLIEVVHKHLRVLLIDPQISIPLLMPLVDKLRSRLTFHIPLTQNYNYVHTAVVCEMFLVLGFPVGKQDSFYDKFLRDSFDQYKNTQLKEEPLQNQSKSFNRRGESVFEIRFQKNLHQIGYWFERNKIIGIREFDILLKGRLASTFLPFERLINAKDMSLVSPISEEQLHLYERSENLWKLNKKEKWHDPLLINLNGPFHQVEGDESVTLRSQQIKKRIAQFYGFKRFVTVKYKEWQQNTPNKKAIEEYLQHIISIS